MMVPAIWLGSALLLVIYTLISPILFFAALFSPYTGPVDFVESLLEDLF